MHAKLAAAVAAVALALPSAALALHAAGAATVATLDEFRRDCGI